MYIAKSVVTLLTLFLVFAASAAEQDLLNRLQANHDALTAAQRDYKRQLEQGALGRAEAADYTDYLRQLRERVSQDCLVLARLDIVLLEKSPCLDNMPRFIMPAPIDQSREQTTTERTATMDAELNAGLSEFDEMLLREQERVKAAVPRADAGGGSGSGGGTGMGDAGAQAEGDAGGQGEGSAQGGQAGVSRDSGDLSGRGDPAVKSGGALPPTGAAGAGGTGTGPLGRPEDIPDGSDDDLVARQMREAAEKETDPELKKKLWEEYRKYKLGAR